MMMIDYTHGVAARVRREPLTAWHMVFGQALACTARQLGTWSTGKPSHIRLELSRPKMQEMERDTCRNLDPSHAILIIDPLT